MTLRDYQLRAVEAIRDAFRSGRLAPLLVAPTGCLTGDTMIAYNHAKRGAKMRLDLFVDRMRGISSHTSPWDTSIPCFVRAPFPDGTVKLARVLDAMYSGMKHVCELTLESGHTLLATRDHRILTTKGYVEMRHLGPHHLVLIDGGIRPAEKLKPKSWYRLKRIPEHPFAARRGLKDKSSSYTVALHRLIAEANLNGMSFESYIKAVKARDKNLTFLDPKVWCVHHVDGNALNNELSNLHVLTHREHNAAHEPDSKKHLESRLIPSRVVGVTKVGLRATYDLEIEGVHAFTANGIAVHNSGKTRIGLEIAARTIARGRRVVWLAHRQELVEQTYDAATALGIDAGIISSVQSRPVRSAPLQIAMMQSCYAVRPEGELAIVDESHHSAATEWRELVRSYRLRVGLTATPERADGRGLSEVFDSLHVAASIKELTAMGHLVPCRVVGPDKELDSSRLAQHPVAAWREHCVDRRTIVFAPSIALAEEWAASLPATVVHSQLPSAERVERVERFRRGDVPVLVNVNICTEGFDVPATSACILARGCGSAGQYLQIVGRILRPSPGKTDALLVDLRGVSHVHGAPDEDREYSLFGRAIRLADERPRFCAVCSQPCEEYPCASCGYEPDSGERPIVFTGERMREIKFARKRLEDTDKRAEYLQRVLQEARAKGYKRGWALYRYAAVYGGPPSREVIERASGRSAA